MTFEPLVYDHTFRGPIGVDVNGEQWACVELPGSAELFGTKKSVRCDVVVDGIEIADAGFMITGRGGHMISLNKALQKRLGKGLGDEVEIVVVRRVK